ncbi:hypothetical protein [Streptomyces sp. NPDC048392]
MQLKSIGICVTTYFWHGEPVETPFPTIDGIQVFAGRYTVGEL